MKDRFKASTDVQVLGLKLQSLALLLDPTTDKRTYITALDFQAALGLDRPTTHKAIEGLTQLGYVIKLPRKPDAYYVTRTIDQLLAQHIHRGVNRAHGLGALQRLIDHLSRFEGDCEHCWVSEVCTSGQILDHRLAEPTFVEVQVTVIVAWAAGAPLGMRRIEKTLNRADKSLKTSLILNLL